MNILAIALAVILIFLVLKFIGKTIIKILFIALIAAAVYYFYKNPF